MIEGVDYAWQRPSVTALVAAGKRFACRYGGAGSAGKQIDRAEAIALTGAGIAIVANVEGAADGMKGGYTVGRAWAAGALDHFRAVGMPERRPIYLSVDFDAGPADWLAVDAALAGAADVLGPSRVGVYGGYDTIAHCAAVGSARWFWQTYAWSGGAWHPRAHIRQYRNGVSLGGAVLDLNRATVSDYGQWGVDVDLNDAVWTKTNADGTKDVRTVRDVLSTMDVRTDYFGNIWRPLHDRATAEIKADVDALAARPAPVLDPVEFARTLAATPAAVDAIAEAVAARVGMLPTAGEIGKAAADEIHRRLQQ